jgi:hypothetical protein
MGNRYFGTELCITYAGLMCGQAYGRLFSTEPGTGSRLADLLRLRTIVVRNGFLPGGGSVTEAPPGWAIDEQTPYTTTLRSTTSPVYPEGRVSWAAPSLTIATDIAGGDTSEQIRYRGGGTVVLALIAWPGWRAEVDGQDIEVRPGPAGLIELTLPDLGREATVHLSFEPAGMRPGLVSYGLGVLLGAGFCVYYTLQQRRRLQATIAAASPGAAPKSDA